MNQEYLQKLFDYHSEGYLVWKVGRSGTAPGKRAGYVNSGDNRRRVGVDRVLYLEHRLIYMYHHGVMPKLLDHINRDVTDNRIENLRPATRAENVINTSARSDSSTKVKGVYQRSKNCYRADITVNKKRILLGHFSTVAEAAKARAEAEKYYYGKFANKTIIEEFS